MIKDLLHRCVLGHFLATAMLQERCRLGADAQMPNLLAWQLIFAAVSHIDLILSQGRAQLIVHVPKGHGLYAGDQ